MARYTDEFRASAVLMLQAAGYPETEGALTAVARRLKIPHQTLSRWGRSAQNPPPPELVQEKKVELKDLIQEELLAIFKEMKTARQDASYRDMGTVWGIFFDKLQLLGGKPTTIQGYDNLGSEQLDAELAKLFDVAGKRASKADS